jgi:hypothetical protein
LIAAPKRVRKRVHVVEEEEDGESGDSEDDSEWEPDWKSEDDDELTGFTQVCLEYAILCPCIQAWLGPVFKGWACVIRCCGFHIIYKSSGDEYGGM